MTRMLKVFAVVIGALSLYNLYNAFAFLNKIPKKKHDVLDVLYAKKETETHKPGPDDTNRHFHGRFQRLNDNTTDVYVGYYDNRKTEAVVKIISIIWRNTTNNYTCIHHFADGTKLNVTGYLKVLLFKVWKEPILQKRGYRDGFLICPVPRRQGIPSYVLVGKSGENVTTKVDVQPPAKRNTTVTRCVRPFLKNYGNITQLVWNIELFNILGVNKHIFYLDNQTQRTIDVLRSYEKDGIVEIKNFTLLKPPEVNPSWLQIAAMQDCLLSELKTSKYVLFFDLDEILFPRKHKNISEMADFLFKGEKNDTKRMGAVRFRCVFFPAYENATNITYPQKELAVKYNIAPLLHTERSATAPPVAMTKVLITPMAVEQMFVHCVEIFQNGWRGRTAKDNIGTVNHYRMKKNKFQFPPVTTEKYMLNYTNTLISAVIRRFERMKMNP